MAPDASTTMVWMHPRQAVKRLVELEVVHGLDDAALDALRDECWDGSEESLEEAGLLGILSFFYETPERGAVDGFVWHATEFWHDTDDVVAELAACLRAERPLYRQLSARERAATENGERRSFLELVLERDDGARTEVAARSLGDVADAFNAELKARGDARRLVELDTGGADWEMYVAMELRLAKKLGTEGALPLADPDLS